MQKDHGWEEWDGRYQDSEEGDDWEEGGSNNEAPCRHQKKQSKKDDQGWYHLDIDAYDQVRLANGEIRYKRRNRGLEDATTRCFLNAIRQCPPRDKWTDEDIDYLVNEFPALSKDILKDINNDNDNVRRLNDLIKVHMTTL